MLYVRRESTELLNSVVAWLATVSMVGHWRAEFEDLRTQNFILRTMITSIREKNLFLN